MLNQQFRDYIRTTPVTLQIPEQAGIETDHCFCLHNWQAVNGESRIDLESDPPPDIAIEVDITNFTNIADYEPFKVAEVWLIRGDTLAIFDLTSGTYIQADVSHSLIPLWQLVKIIKSNRSIYSNNPISFKENT